MTTSRIALALVGGIALSSFHYHHARLIEILACTERIEAMLSDPTLLDRRVRAQAGINRTRAVGVSEAPRGTLFHDYEVDAHGILTNVNMIIATGQNNLAMNATVAQIAREWITGPGIEEPMLNRIEAGIRAFDPCLSCSTHADGTLALAVRLLASDGRVLAEAGR